MIIKYSNGQLSRRTSAIDISEGYKSLLIIGKASTDVMAGEIVKPKNIKDFIKTYDSSSDLYDAFSQSHNLGVENLFVANCYNDSDYLKIIDELIHYDFTYVAPINLFLSDMFYDPIMGVQRYYADYFLSMFYEANNPITIIMTERHASLYDDMDIFLIEMNDVVFKYKEHTSEARMPHELNNFGSNLIFVSNNLEDIEHANVILASQMCLSNISSYPENVNLKTVYDIDSVDLLNPDMVYYKYNDLMKSTNVDNFVNMRLSEDIYKNALIDEVIKELIRQMNIDEFKGKIYNIYTKMQIETRVKQVFNMLKGRIFKDYNIVNIGFINTEATSGYVYLEATIIPYGTFEVINVAMGV